MQGPDNLKVGKTDIIDSKGNRVVTETTNENTLDGKSIWTISQQIDNNNDGVFDSFNVTTKTYDLSTGKILEETEQYSGKLDPNKTFKHNRKYLYETETGNLVKVNIDDGEYVERYEYNDKGQLVKKSEFDKANEKSWNGHPRSTESYSYYQNGKLKEEVVTLDHNTNGKLDGYDSQFERKFDQNGNRISQIDRGSNGYTEYKYDKNGKVISKKFTKNEPAESEKQEEPAKAEEKQGSKEKQGYEIPSYKPYSQEGEKKHPPMMGV